MKIVTVCGMGFGTSLMLKMIIEDILKQEGVKADVNAWDLGSVKGMAADYFFASEDIKSNMRDIHGKVIFIKNITDVKEVREKVLQAIK